MYFQKREEYLLISAEGERNDPVVITENSNKIYAKIIETQSSKVLLDYRAVQFNIPQTLAFNSVRHYENKMPSLNKVIIAAVVNAGNEQLGSLWSKVAVERGFRFNTFTDYNEAENWLLKQKL